MSTVKTWSRTRANNGDTRRPTDRRPVYHIWWAAGAFVVHRMTRVRPNNLANKHIRSVMALRYTGGTIRSGLGMVNWACVPQRAVHCNAGGRVIARRYEVPLRTRVCFTQGQ
jgi:hypothetical protein